SEFRQPRKSRMAGESDGASVSDALFPSFQAGSGTDPAPASFPPRSASWNKSGRVRTQRQAPLPQPVSSDPGHYSLSPFQSSHPSDKDCRPAHQITGRSDALPPGKKAPKPHPRTDPSVLPTESDWSARPSGCPHSEPCILPMLPLPAPEEPACFLHFSSVRIRIPAQILHRKRQQDVPVLLLPELPSECPALCRLPHDRYKSHACGLRCSREAAVRTGDNFPFWNRCNPDSWPAWIHSAGKPCESLHLLNPDSPVFSQVPLSKPGRYLRKSRYTVPAPCLPSARLPDCCFLLPS